MKFAPLGDGALVVTCVGEGVDAAMEAAVKLAAAVTVAHWPGVVDVVPAYASVAVFYDSVAVGEDPYARLCDAIAVLEAEVSKAGFEKSKFNLSLIPILGRNGNCSSN